MYHVAAMLLEMLTKNNICYTAGQIPYPLYKITSSK